MTYVISYEYISTVTGAQWVAIGSWIAITAVTRFSGAWNLVDVREMDAGW